MQKSLIEWVLKRYNIQCEDNFPVRLKLFQYFHNEWAWIEGLVEYSENVIIDLATN